MARQQTRPICPRAASAVFTAAVLGLAGCATPPPQQEVFVTPT